MKSTSTGNTLSIARINIIEPKTKEQDEQYQDYINKLGLTTPGEKFVLLTILSFDWRRLKILEEIRSIRQTGSLIDFYISFRAPRVITNYSVSSPYDNTGWTEEYSKSLEKRMWYVYHKLESYTDAY